MSNRLGMPMIEGSPKMYDDLAKSQLRLDMENRFSHHVPKGDQAERYQTNRALFIALANGLTQICPVSRELSLTMTKLDEALFYANASIARNE